MRGLWKLTVSTLGHGARYIPFRLHSGRPPAPLGSRILTNPDDVFQHNTWDHVQWSPEEFEKAKLKAEENSRDQIPVEEQDKYERDAHKYWNGFYEMHQNKFFKNRQWLFSEFPELLPPGSETNHASGGQKSRETDQVSRGSSHTASLTDSPEVLGEQQQQQDDTRYSSAVKSHKSVAFPGQHASFRILEVGCGAGNSVFPIMKTTRHSNTFLYCFDFSSQAIQLVKEHPDYDPAVCHAFVRDICDGVSLFPFPHGSLDVILVIFVLSSIHPKRIQGVLNRLSGYLKPGGVILFKDYGRYDLSQLRFKKGQCLSENFYTRQDGTCVYFFTKEEVHQMFTNAGLEEIQNLEDRRLQVNRKQRLVMHRVWIQCKYKKP